MFNIDKIDKQILWFTISVHNTIMIGIFLNFNMV